MLHGKKGFEKIVWAFTNVLTQSMAWLFHDLESNPGQDEGTKPINKVQPQLITCEPQEIDHEQIITPPFFNEKGKVLDKMSEGDLQEHCGSLSEWLAMVQMASPRLSGEDDVDPYLSRYAVPDADESQTSDLMSLKWHGLISSRWVMQLFLNLLQSKASNLSWFALAVATLGKEAVEGRDGFTVMVLPSGSSEPKQTEEYQDNKRTSGSDGRMTLCWELMGASVTEP
jgi:ribonuclease P/MRP protein subunit RPP40